MKSFYYLWISLSIIINGNDDIKERRLIGLSLVNECPRNEFCPSFRQLLYDFPLINLYMGRVYSVSNQTFDWKRMRRKLSVFHEHCHDTVDWQYPISK